MAKKLNTANAAARFAKLGDSVEKEQNAIERTDIIPIDSIVFNEDNIFNIEDSDESIAELAQNIKENGLLHNIVVAEIEANKYLLISGERRTKAVKYLGDDKIRATIKKNLSELEVLKMLFFANSETREYTTEEKIQIIEGFLAKIKKFDATPEKEAANKFREYVAQAFHVSQRQANKLIAITSDLSLPLKELLYEDIININTAAALAQLPDEYQIFAVDIIKASSDDDSDAKKYAVERALDFAKRAKNIISKTNTALAKEKTSRIYYNGRLAQAKEELSKIEKDIASGADQSEIDELENKKSDIEKALSKYVASLEQVDKEIDVETQKQNSEVKKVYTNTIFSVGKGIDAVQKDKSGKIAQSQKIDKEIQAIDKAINRLLDMNPAEELKKMQELMGNYKSKYRF